MRSGDARALAVAHPYPNLLWMYKVLGFKPGADFELAPPDRLQASSYIFALEVVPAAELEGFSRMKLSVSVARGTERTKGTSA